MSAAIVRRQAVPLVSTGSVDSLAPTWGSATLDGSLLVLIVAVGGTQPSGLCSVPHGWTLAYQTPDGTFDGFGVWVKEYAASESGAVPVSWVGSNNAHAVAALLEYQGASAVNVVDLVIDGFAVSSRVKAGGTQTPSESGETLFGVIVTHYNEAQTLEANGSWAQVINAYDAGTLATAKPGVGVYEYPAATKLTPASVHADVSGGVAWHSVMLSFRALPDPAVPAYSVQAQWGGRNTGLFLIGTSVLDGTDVLGGAFGLGSYDDFDQAHGALTTTITRGRQDASSPVQAGTCTIVARDSDGRYNPANAASPLAGLLVPMRPIRVQAVFGEATYNLFTGFIQSIYDDPSIQAQTATFQCQDLFSWLSATPTIVALGATTTGAAIEALLDGVDIPNSLIAADTGDTIPNFSTDGTTTILDVITNLLTAERGWCFVDANGVFTYQSRNAKYLASSSGILDDVMTGLVPGTDLTTLYNRAQAQRTGGTNQVIVDQQSIFQYGYRDLPAITSDYLNTDAQAKQLASYLVATNKDPRAPIWNLTLARDENPALVQQMLGYDLGDVVTIADGRGGTAGDYVIEGIQHTIQGGGLDHTVSWTLSQRRSGVFIIGQSTLDGGDFLTY